MLLSGYFSSNDNVLFYFKPLQWISAFRYGYQILSEIEFTSMQPLNCVYNYMVPCNPLKDRLDFSETLISSIIILSSIAIFFKLVALMILFIKGKNQN